MQTERERRLAYLDRQNARCDANSRSCVNRAVDIFHVYRTDGHGNRVSDEVENKQSCGYHRVQFDQSAMYEVVGRSRVLSRDETKRSRQPARKAKVDEIKWDDGR